jgi:CheY-like chemotaxis protein
MTYPLVLVTAGTPETALRISEGLARYGYETLVALDEADALALLVAERRIDVVVADIDSGGLQIARRARDLRRTTGIIYTAAAPHRMANQEKVQGAPVLRTPYTAHQLVSLIAGLGKPHLDEPLAA